MNQANVTRLSALDAAYQVLVEVKQPLHYREICQRILAQKLWQTQGKTPDW
ncbi:MAG: winged helix-turn-helix domain-containing protein [Anaerolineae bacterium]